MAMNEDGNASALAGLSDGELRARDLGKKIANEAEAWKVAQLAAQLTVTIALTEGKGDHPSFVKEARAILAESRRQVAAAAVGEG